MIKVYGRHGIVFDEVLELIPFKQSKWLEIYITFGTQKRNQVVNDFENDF